MCNSPYYCNNNWILNWFSCPYYSIYIIVLTFSTQHNTLTHTLNWAEIICLWPWAFFALITWSAWSLLRLWLLVKFAYKEMMHCSSFFSEHHSQYGVVRSHYKRFQLWNQMDLVPIWHGHLLDKVTRRPSGTLSVIFSKRCFSGSTWITYLSIQIVKMFI